MAEPEKRDRPTPVEPPAPDGRDPARARYYLIAALRLGGAALVIAGIMAMEGRLDWGREVGTVLAIAGLVDFFLVPRLLARRWKSPPQ